MTNEQVIITIDKTDLTEVEDMLQGAGIYYETEAQE